MNKGLFSKSVKFNSFNRIKAVSIIFVFVMILSLFSARVFAAETDKDITLDDGTRHKAKVRSILPSENPQTRTRCHGAIRVGMIPNLLELESMRPPPRDEYIERQTLGLVRERRHLGSYGASRGWKTLVNNPSHSPLLSGAELGTSGRQYECQLP